MTALGDKIKALRRKGMSYKAIARGIPCSLSTVNFTLSEGAKGKVAARNRNRRRRITRKIKEQYGASCAVCGYDRCLEALDFDHLDPKDKVERVSQFRHGMGPALEEAAKCILLCCRCHRERHAGVIDIGAYLEPTL